MLYSVPLSEMIEVFRLKNLSRETEFPGKFLERAEINRPALQLAGFYDYFDSDRIQIIGLVEYTFLQKMERDVRAKTLYRMFQYQIPCIVICRGLEPFPEMVSYSDEFSIPIFGTEASTTDFMGEIIPWLKTQLAPRITIHGVLVDVYGEGLLIIGESGIGKSETALELVKRGHRLVADDAVEIRRVSQLTLVGSCPESIRYFIELRGIGIIDVRKMFGVESVKATQSIDLIVKLEHWDKNKEYERVGLEQEHMEILGNQIACHSIPIRPGRNLAIICESAAINHRQKKMGYNAAQELIERRMGGNAGNR